MKRMYPTEIISSNTNLQTTWEALSLEYDRRLQLSGFESVEKLTDGVRLLVPLAAGPTHFWL